MTMRGLQNRPDKTHREPLNASPFKQPHGSAEAGGVENKQKKKGRFLHRRNRLNNKQTQSTHGTVYYHGLTTYMVWPDDLHRAPFNWQLRPLKHQPRTVRLEPVSPCKWANPT
eukprot:scaffold1337_cov165-Pinguiococcus_pyrenoidosus.AAC.3